MTITSVVVSLSECILIAVFIVFIWTDVIIIFVFVVLICNFIDAMMTFIMMTLTAQFLYLSVFVLRYWCYSLLSVIYCWTYDFSVELSPIGLVYIMCCLDVLSEPCFSVRFVCFSVRLVSIYYLLLSVIFDIFLVLSV